MKLNLTAEKRGAACRRHPNTYFLPTINRLLSRLVGCALISLLPSAVFAIALTDLRVSIVSAPNPASTGSNLTYTVTVTNAGPATASDVVLTNILSPGQVLDGGAGACPQPGPVAWWKAEGNAIDSAGANNGTLVTDAGFDLAGKVGQAFSFDNSDGYVTFDDAPALRPVSFTIEGWFKPNSFDSADILVAKPLGAGNADSFALFLLAGFPAVLISDNGGLGPVLSAPNAITAGQWHHLAFTFDDASQTQILYVDGVGVASGPTGKSVAYDSNPVIIGADFEFAAPALFYDGLADEVSLYNRVLTAAEIQGIFTADTTGKCTASTVFLLGDIPSLGTTNITLTALATICSGFLTNIAVVTTTAFDTDQSNNQATNVVSVLDHTKPAITCPADQVVNATLGTCTASVVLGTPITSDNCGVASVTSNAPALFSVGITMVTWTVTDTNGNSATCLQSITVEDHQNPTITCPANLVVSTDPGICTASGLLLGVPTVGDNCAVASVSSNGPEVYLLGETIVTWTVTDTSGNTFSCEQTVTVQDHELPTIGCSADLMINLGPGMCSVSEVDLGPITVGDNCMVSSAGNNAPFAFPAGTNLVTHSVTDASGNTQTCVQKVIVLENVPPSITCPPNVTVNTDPGQCTASGVALGTPTVGDNCAVLSVTSNAPAAFPIGTTMVTWTVKDTSGNIANCQQSVTVEDHQNPVVVCPPNIVTNEPTAGAGMMTVNYTPPVGTDNCPGVMTACVPPPGSSFNLGTTPVNCTSTDASMNTGGCSFTVTVNVASPVPSADLALWLRADMGVVTNSPEVTQWTDQSSSLRNATQGITANQPVFRPNAVNGLPAVRFDGVNDFLTFNLPVNGLSGMTIFLIAANSQNQTSGPVQAERAALFWNETASWGTLYLTPFQSSVPFRFGTTQPGNLPLYNRPVSVGTNFTLSTAMKSGTTDSLRVNKTQVLSQGGKLNTIAGCRAAASIGRGFNDNTFFAGDIAEILVYTRALPVSERDAVEAYLDNKYGVTLPPPPQPPFIQSQPANANVVEPGPASFSVTATGTAPLHYQWRRGVVDIAGANSSTYLLDPTAASDNGAQFTVVITNTVGSITSVVATLTVAPPGSMPLADMWLRADAGTVANGQSLTQWNDQSGHNRHATQAGVNDQPLVIPGGLNGLPTVRFDGMNDYLSFTLPVTGLTGMTIFMVAANSQNQVPGFTQAERAALFWNETSGWGATYLTPFQSSVALRFGTTQAGNLMLHSRPASIASQFSLSTSLKNGNTDTLRVNKTQVLSQTGKLVTMAGARNIGNLGRGFNDNTFFAGEIAEVLVYTRTLNAAERDTVEQYLDNKYALTGPPTPQAPTIHTQPADATAIEPGSATFSVGASGTAPLSYQWRREGIDLAGETGTSLTVNPTSAADDMAHFDVVVTNQVGSVTSLVATLTVLPPGSLPATGRELWLRADSGTVTSGSALTQWNDQSGHDRHATQGAGANQPLVVTGMLNGLPIVRFDGLNDFLSFTLPVNGLTGMSIFLVAANTQNQTPGITQAERAALFWNETTSWGTIYLSPFQSRVNFRFGTSQAGNQPVFNRPVSLASGFSITSAIKNGATDSLYVNGSLVLSQDGKLTTIANCQSAGNVGRGYNGNTFFAGDIAEILVYSRALDAGEQQLVENYLENKYGLAMMAAPFGTVSFVVGSELQAQITKGEILLTLTGQAGQSYIVESSTDLVKWSAVATIDLSKGGAGRGTLTLPADEAAAYFRARLK